MRAIFLTNTFDGPLKAPQANDVHGHRLEFKAKGSAPVDERAFHDAWVRAMLDRSVLLVDTKLASAHARDGSTPDELGLEIARRLGMAGFSETQVRGWLPAAVATLTGEASNMRRAQAEAARVAAEAARAEAAAKAQADADAAAAAAAAQAEADARAAAELAAEEAAKEAAAAAALQAEADAKAAAELAAEADAKAAAELAAEEAAKEAASLQAEAELEASKVSETGDTESTSVEEPVAETKSPSKKRR